ncbi:hypothetical protein [Aeromicrobium wangtongii]|uniref:Uncharacterized protein n=1 Tax=Aeromicrobium wangtongii TaxID=2969247 RepID=A0ABY5M2J2_9ACTN|nr:hypothetical protein [Aeromicrobium wangtongii]MCD9198379.1 hypothetical protein [Aeromicrobium wangtongii]UUP12410.1 hypothetical protein NQV15_11145 [Aeromicrobium wangtongii]
MASLLPAAACGSGLAAERGGGDLPITPRAIAAVALDHVPGDTTSRRAIFDDPKETRDVGISFRYGSETDGSSLGVSVTPDVDRPVCDDELLDGCVKREVDDGTMVLKWQEEEPEEDPGFVSVTLHAADREVSVAWLPDEAITGDPRRQRLRIPVAAMEDLVQDERLRPTTSQATIDAGERVDDWLGGEPDPSQISETTATGNGLINGYLRTADGGTARDRRPSPLVRELGAGAVGGRFTTSRLGDDPSPTVDVLVAPGPPDWFADDPCDTERFAGHCVVDPQGHYFAWIPGPADGSGQIWMFTWRDEDTFVAVRKSHVTVPEYEGAAKLVGEWDLVFVHLDSRNIGFMIDRELLDDDPALSPAGGTMEP